MSTSSEAAARTIRAGWMRWGTSLLGKFSVGVIDQIVLSGSSFLVGLLLIRQTSDSDYGMFVLVQSAITLLISAQTAWLSSPLAVLAPGKPAALRRLMVGAITASQRRFLRRACAIAIIVPLLGYTFGVWSGLESGVVLFAIAACGASLQKENLRNILLIFSRPHAVLMADLVVVAVLLVGALLAVVAPGPAVLWAVGALIASALAGESMTRRALAQNPGLAPGEAKPFWKEMRPLAVWATIGAMTYWLYTQSYNYILAGEVGLGAVADVNATRLFLMPTIVLTVGVKSLLVPTAASWLADSGLGRMIRRLIIFACVVAAINLLYCGVLWFFRDFVTDDIMHKSISNRDELLMLWGALSLIAVFRDLLQTGLFALHKFQSLAAITALSAVVALSVMGVGIRAWGPVGALLGQVAGEVVNLGGVALLLISAFRAQRRNLRRSAEGVHISGARVSTI